MISRMFSVENKTFKIHYQHVCNNLQFAYLLVLDLGIKSGALSMLKNYSQLNCVPRLRMLPSFHWIEHLQMAPVLKINIRSLKKNEIEKLVLWHQQEESIRGQLLPVACLF